MIYFTTVSAVDIFDGNVNDGLLWLRKRNVPEGNMARAMYSQKIRDKKNTDDEFYEADKPKK